jgi:hypothetical protein
MSTCIAIVKKTGHVCTKISKTGSEYCGIHGPKTPREKAVVDLATPAVVRALYKAFVADETAMAEIEASAPGLHVRRYGMRMELSENMVKFAIKSRGDDSCTWGCKVGDLRSIIENIQEVKSVTAIDSPTSFGPTQPWNVIYFLDASNWRDDLFIIYRIPLPNTHPFWKTLPMNKKETKGDQSDSKRRPRTVWNTTIKPLLAEQFPEFVTTPFYSGTFEGIFSPPPAVAPIA